MKITLINPSPDLVETLLKGGIKAAALDWPAEDVESLRQDMLRSERNRRRRERRRQLKEAGR